MDMDIELARTSGRLPPVIASGVFQAPAQPIKWLLHQFTHDNVFGGNVGMPKMSPEDLRRDHLAALIEIWPNIKDRKEPHTKWGDEIEYCLLNLDHENHRVELATEASQVIGELQNHNHVDIQQEAYAYMVESCPAKPFGSDLQTLAQVEEDMLARRKVIQQKLKTSSVVTSISRFGMFGAPSPRYGESVTSSDLLKKDARSLIAAKRYAAINDLIDERRGFQMKDEVPLYDSTPSSSVPSSSASSLFSLSNASSDSECSVKPETIAVDDIIYGLGGCAIQVNFGMKDASEALHLHDQFCPIGPLMLAMTAGSPIIRGFLIKTDSRWSNCSSALDDRQPDESNLNPRWGTSPMYFEDLPPVQALNDYLSEANEKDAQFTEQLKEAGWPQTLARYYASTLNRYQMIFPKASMGSHEGDANEDRISRLKTHLSTLWPHVRLKFPVSESGLPWIIEARSMEAQPTDFENAAIAVFLHLLKETILHFALELRVSISMVDQNMNRAQAADAIETQKFWFNVGNDLSGPGRSGPLTEELTMNEIFNGYVSDVTEHKAFPGLLHYVREYLSVQAEKTNISPASLTKIKSYVEFISRRASGEEPTPAKWMREFMLKHAEYRDDCRVTQKMYYDMVCKIVERSHIKA